MMQRTSQDFAHQKSSRQSQRIFAASEIAEFEYCALTWWYQRYEPLARTDSEELFARMVELEHDHGPQATALPEYQVIEQLLVRRGAFSEGQDQYQEEEGTIGESLDRDAHDEEQWQAPGAVDEELRLRLRRVIIGMLALAVMLIVVAIAFWFMTR